MKLEKTKSEKSFPGFEEKKKEHIEKKNKKESPLILPPLNAKDSIELVKNAGIEVTSAILDPWYNKGIGGERDDYHEWLDSILRTVSPITEHIFTWGFPEIVYKVMDYIPKDKEFVAWLTWYFKNCPSRKSGWRSAQMTCIHLANPDAKLYPEHFLNEAQIEKKKKGKLQYMPGPPNVIEEPLLVGFVGRKEQTGHPSQKPYRTIEPLIKMSTAEGDIIFDPFCGSGTSGEVARDMGRKSILSDNSDKYLKMAEKRLGIKRLNESEIEEKLEEFI